MLQSSALTMTLVTIAMTMASCPDCAEVEQARASAHARI